MSVYAVDIATGASDQVPSIEQSLEKAKATSFYSDATRCDPNWETDIIRENTTLHITQHNHSDRFPRIPLRAANDTTQVLQPW